ncbi:acyl-CoA dehydrogenase [Mycetocola tolaasinivorans]|uniref:Acyl-CoA dehydrogenase n=1 Tax=Mycetocola tolaasinivorans TaxID=76635 RepID=A0A3L7ACV4_9MICO|nr:acyl-CoA dehydrogenase family protein [Mycetocola tolaasinivorans]RLP78057.1 acyl-CoA dehydrogenase [Mycetocola tolaasinivorans]
MNTPLTATLGITDSEVLNALPSPGDIAGALALAQDLGTRRAYPGDGTTGEQWGLLAAIAAHDLGIVRAIEPHLDAVAILTQANIDPLPGAWGVFASEGGSDPVRATRVGEGWALTGTKRWCSLAARLDHALVTAQTQSGNPRLFALDLRAPGVTILDPKWAALGLREIPSGPVRCASVPAAGVGASGWYSARPGFAWGGVGVAACWFGGAVAIARSVREAAARAHNPHTLAHLGAMDTLLHACRLALNDAARQADNQEPGGKLTAWRVRGLVARACEDIIHRAGHSLGPGPLAHDAEHAKRVSDLSLYIRQHHGEADDAAQGEAVAGFGSTPW